MFFKICVLKFFRNFTEKYLCWSKGRSFPVKFAKLLRTSFLLSISDECLWLMFLKAENINALKASGKWYFSLLIHKSNFSNQVLQSYFTFEKHQLPKTLRCALRYIIFGKILIFCWQKLERVLGRQHINAYRIWKKNKYEKYAPLVVSNNKNHDERTIRVLSFFKKYFNS